MILKPGLKADCFYTVVKNLFLDNEIRGDGLDKIFVGLKNLSDYLYPKIDIYSDVEEKMSTMLAYIVDPKIRQLEWEKGRVEGIREGIKEGIREGIKEGIREGIKKGEKKGVLEGSIKTVINAINYGLDMDIISKIQALPLSCIIQIQNLIKQEKSYSDIEDAIIQQYTIGN